MDRKKKFKGVFDLFEKHMPVVETELHYSNPYELLVAVVLSAQCTDKRVNMVTPELFKKFPDARKLSAATPEEIYPYIKSISYPFNKAKHLSGLGKMLMEEFQGQVPEENESLEKLPGVGRKTANVITNAIFDKPTVAVDTHVFRVSARLGLTKDARTPLETEKQIIANAPKDKLNRVSHWLIMHGRYICIARRPKCEVCFLTDYCDYYHQVMKFIIDQQVSPRSNEKKIKTQTKINKKKTSQKKGNIPNNKPAKKAK